MSDDRIIAEYLVETPLSLEAAAASMAGEQSTGTFTRVPGETEELRERFAARLEGIEELEIVRGPRCRELSRKRRMACIGEEKCGSVFRSRTWGRICR